MKEPTLKDDGDTMSGAVAFGRIASGVSLEQFDTSASARATQRPPIGARQSAGFAVLSVTDSDVRPFRGHTTSGVSLE